MQTGPSLHWNSTKDKCVVCICCFCFLFLNSLWILQSLISTQLFAVAPRLILYSFPVVCIKPTKPFCRTCILVFVSACWIFSYGMQTLFFFWLKNNYFTEFCCFLSNINVSQPWPMKGAGRTLGWFLRQHFSLCHFQLSRPHPFFPVAAAHGRQPQVLSFPPKVLILVSGIIISFFCSVRPRGGKNFVVLLISGLPHCPFSVSALPSLG